MLQSGLNESWWADSMECYTCLRNVTDLLSDGKTPYERRFGQPFKGPIIPFGSLVEYHPITAKDQSRIHQFRKKVLPGLFLGYALYAGRIWKGDIMVADIEELKDSMQKRWYFPKKMDINENSRREQTWLQAELETEKELIKELVSGSGRIEKDLLYWIWEYSTMQNPWSFPARIAGKPVHSESCQETFLKNTFESDETTASCLRHEYARSPTATQCEPVFLSTGRPVARMDETNKDNQSFTIPTPRFVGNASTWNPPSVAEGTYSQIIWVNRQRIRSRRCIAISS